MFRDILKYGLISGLIVGGIDFVMFTTMDQHDFENGMLIGYSIMRAGLLDGFVVDETEQEGGPHLDVRVLFARTLMTNLADKEALGRAVLGFADSIQDKTG